MKHKAKRRRGTNRNKRLTPAQEFPGDDGTYFDDNDELEWLSSGGPDTPQPNGA